MGSGYEIELTDPDLSHCTCCGGLTVRLTRFVHCDGDAFAVYYATYSNNHPDSELAMLVSLGPWGEGTARDDRAAFFCRVRVTEDSYQVMLGDGATSAWSGAKLMGTLLSREAARAHPWKATAFEVLDHGFAHDPGLIGFLRRVRCGDAAAPLEQSYGAPDDVFALGEAKEGRVELHRNFASLDGTRFFVRCLFPIPVASYRAWCVGVWVEVAKADYERARDAWDDAEQYARLRFSGTLANTAGAKLGLPIVAGTPVHVGVPDPESVLTIVGSPDARVQETLDTEWPKERFETYAVTHGYL